LYVKAAQKEIIGFQRVMTFLSSMERNSPSSRYAYQAGLIHFQRLLSQKYPSYNLETILKPLAENKINPYELLDGFISYMRSTNTTLTPSTIKLYMASVRSYFAYNDVDIIPSKFKRKVKMPKSYREDEEPLDVSDIRKILLACNNRRVKAKNGKAAKKEHSTFFPYESMCNTPKISPSLCADILQASN
jgi:integrase